MDPQEDLIDRDVTLTVVIPGGQETTATVHGSKPVMDVLVTLCAQHHLVPSDHVIKLISTNQNHVNFKPNSMIGSLEFEKVVLQIKGSDANKKKPHIPVATVRLLINYKKSFKAVVRVNPAVPLAELMPTVCEKLEFDPDATVLLRTDQSEEPLDLSKTLNDYALRELYAKEVKVVPPVDPLSAHKGADGEQKTSMKEKKHSEKGNKGFFGLFKKSKKTSEQAVNDGAPDSPPLNGQHSDRVNGVNGHSTLPMIPADLPKKRRAPPPPLRASQSASSGLHIRDFSDPSESDPAGTEGLLSRISSTESSLKRTKRRAPPPPGDGPTPPDSDNREERAQWAYRSSRKYKDHIDSHCPQIAKVMSELTKSLQTRQQRTLSSNSSVSQNSSEEACTPEAELKALPVGQLQRQSSDRGLTTFTVVPQRRQQTETQSSHTHTDRAQAHVCPGEVLKIHTEDFTNGGSSSDESEHELEVLHLKIEKQFWMEVDGENINICEDHETINPKNSEFNELPVYELLRKSFEREGFTTFTVVPQRRQLSFEEPVTSQIDDSEEAEAHVCPGDPEAPESPTTEPGEAVPTEQFTDGGDSSFENEHISKDQHLEKERQAWMKDKSENEDKIINTKNSEFNALPVCQRLRKSSVGESFTTFTVVPQRRQIEHVELSHELDQCVNPVNTELRFSESPQWLLNSLQQLGREIYDHEEHVSDGSSKPGNISPVVEEEEKEDDEAGEAEDWIEEYKERRRKFLSGANDCIKELDVWGRIQRQITNTPEENTIDETDFPSPPPPVYWDENRGENEEDKANGCEQEMLTCDEVNLNLAQRISSKPKFVSFSEYAKPNAHSALNNAEPNASGAQNNCRFAPELHRSSFLSASHSSADPCPPAGVSPFALAVFQKAKHSKAEPDPNCSRRPQLPVNTQ